MKNFKGLKILTKVSRNYFIWSLSGILCFTCWFFLIYTQPTAQTLEKLASDIAIECIVVGIIGLMLVLSSCGRYYFRLGIVPGVYHSTLCIPEWSLGRISFKISDGVYFSVISGMIFFVLYGTVVYSLFFLKDYYVFTFQVQTYASGMMVMYNYMKRDQNRREALGIFVVMVCSNGIFVYNFMEVHLEHVGIGGLLASVNLACVISIVQANKCLDNHSTAILTAIVQGFFGVILLCFILFYTVEPLEILSLGKGAIFSMFLYCFTRCSVTEATLLLVYPCFCTVFIEIFSIGCLITLFGAVCGVLIVVFGDLPGIIYHRCKTERNKSPLNSPLLI